MESSLREITMEELTKNNGDNADLWVLIHNKIYDLTNFKHPGGKEILMDPIGEDRGDEFDSIHSPNVKDEMKKYLIGQLKVEKEKKSDKKNDDYDGKVKTGENSGINPVLVAIVLIIVALIVYKLKFA